MQQQTPPQGRLFPDPPQEQQSAPRFQNTLSQAYEPQQRMQQTGSFPTYHSARYTTSSMQPLHSTQPVTSMPPMATMPTAQVYQQQQAMQQPQANAAVVHTVQGTPVLVTLEQLEESIRELKARSGLNELPEVQKIEPITGKKLRKAKNAKAKADMKTEIKTEIRAEKKARPIRITFSVAWCFFGVVGVISTVIFLLEYFGIPFLVYLEEIIGGLK